MRSRDQLERTNADLGDDRAAAALVAELVPGPSPRRQAVVLAFVALALFGLLVVSGDGFKAAFNDWRHTEALGGDLRAVDGPLELRSRAATVALDDGRVLIWGGQSTSSDSANVYDPATGTWEHLPAAPGPPRFDAAEVWTGTEAVIWGGSTAAGAFDPRGVAWNPATGTWRELPPAPVALAGARAVAFPDLDAILFTGGDQATSSGTASSLWFADDTWTVVPTPIEVVNTAWDGDRLLATGPVPWTTGVEGPPGWPVIAFDPDRLNWTQVADPLATQWMAIAVADDGVVSAVTLEDLNAPLRAYQWTGEAWDQVAETERGADGVITIHITSYPPVALWTGERLLVGGEGALTAWDPTARSFATRSDDRIPDLRWHGGVERDLGGGAVQPELRGLGVDPGPRLSATRPLGFRVAHLLRSSHG